MQLGMAVVQHDRPDVELLRQGRLDRRLDLLAIAADRRPIHHQRDCRGPLARARVRGQQFRHSRRDSRPVV